MHRIVAVFCVFTCLLAVPRLGTAQERALRDPFLLTGNRLRGAFREVVAEPRMWTVEILDAEDHRISLGVVITADGEILTKASELKSPIRCRLSGRQTLEARLIATDPINDLALLQVDASDLIPVVWQDIPLTEGQWLITPGITDTPVAVGVLGGQPRAIPQSVRGVLGIQMDVGAPPTIIRVFDAGGGKAAGIENGDVILQIDNKEMADSRMVVDTVQKYRPGDKIALKLQRGEEQLELTATLTHPFGELLSRIAMQNQLGGELSDRRDDFPLVFQHDAVLKPRDCGGVVVDLQGQAVGLNIARAGRTETYALPVASIIKSLETLHAAAITTTNTTTNQLDK